MTAERLIDAASEALSLADVKNHLRITDNDNDDALRLFIAAIRHRTETYLSQTLITSTWQYTLDDFEDEINLPMGPVQSITSVQYADEDGNEQTLDASLYQFDVRRIKAAYGNAWPTARKQYDAVTITYLSGKQHAGQVQADIKLAMLLWIGACDINRENNLVGTVVSEIPGGAESLLRPYRSWHL